MTSRALVLGGGGALGVAWETGLLAGLEREGVSFGNADLILGTSAGSIVGSTGAAIGVTATIREVMVSAPLTCKACSHP